MQKQHQSASHAPKSKFNLITKFTRLRNANIHYNGEIFTRDSDATVYVESQLGDCMYMMVTDQVTMSVAWGQYQHIRDSEIPPWKSYRSWRVHKASCYGLCSDNKYKKSKIVFKHLRSSVTPMTISNVHLHNVTNHLTSAAMWRVGVSRRLFSVSGSKSLTPLQSAPVFKEPRLRRTYSYSQQ